MPTPRAPLALLAAAWITSGLVVRPCLAGPVRLARPPDPLPDATLDALLRLEAQGRAVTLDLHRPRPDAERPAEFTWWRAKRLLAQVAEASEALQLVQHPPGSPPEPGVLISLRAGDQRRDLALTEMVDQEPGEPLRFPGVHRLTSALLDLVDPAGRPRAVFLPQTEGAPTGPQLRVGLSEAGILSADWTPSEEVSAARDLLVLTTPAGDLSPPVAAVVRRHLEAGGAGLFLLGRRPEAPRLDDVLASVGVDLTGAQAMEARGPGAVRVRRPQANRHALTMVEEVAASPVLSWAQALEATPLGRRRFDVRTLLQAPWTSWGERGPVTATSRHDAQDLPPLLSLAVAVSSRPGLNDGLQVRRVGEMRLVVVGDHGMASAQGLRENPQNLRFLVRAARWALGPTVRKEALALPSTREGE